MYWKEWLQTLLSLIILLGLLEMLLPPGGLEKFAKLVLGLALVLALLQPLAIILNRDIQLYDFSWINEFSSEPDIQVLAERLQLAATTPYLRPGEDQLTIQIQNVLRNLDDVEDVIVRMENIGGNSTSISIFLLPFSAGLAETAGQIVASMLNIPIGQISVQPWNE